MSGALAGVKVLDLSRLVPGPYCSLLLAQQGADVIIVRGGPGSTPIPVLARGKRVVTLDLRDPLGRSALHRLVRTADVLLEGFRPGVAARVGAGYTELAALNPRLVYCSLTGYGQSGPRSAEAGHDINYLAVSGVLGALGPPDSDPIPPLNLLADFGAGALAAAFGIAAALVERTRTGRGQYLDVAMVEGCVSMMAFHRAVWRTPAMPERGRGVLGGRAPWYRTYRCADGRYVAVGALERLFFLRLWDALDFRDEAPDQRDPSAWTGIERRLEAKFAEADRDVWVERFIGVDACVTPVLAPDEVGSEADGWVPVDESAAVLREAGASVEEIEAALAAALVRNAEPAPWPPAAAVE
jgi:alpha-methylacyl-CoA racemase